MNKQQNGQEQLLFSIIVPDFITKIQLSKSRKPIYYEKDGKYIVPLNKQKHIKPFGKCKFEWKFHKIGAKIKIILFDTKTLEPVIKNSRAVGTPKYLAIKGNNIYSGFGGYRNRVIIINAIKDNFRHYFKGKKTEVFPIYLTFTIYDELNLKSSKGKSQSQDLDNLCSLYVKASQDLMKAEKVIPDDNLSFIRKTTYEFIESKEKKMVINAYKYKKED